MKLKSEKRVIAVVLLFIAGLSLLLYPFVANQWNSYRQSKLINSYDSQIAQMESQGEVNYEEQWEMAHAYNQALEPCILPDSFAVAAASGENGAYMSCLNLTEDGMMGYVEIPKIDVKIPIFHTTEEDVLQKAAGHLEGSSLPVGGENTHTVISAHRGLPSASLFTDLDKLTVGDHFLLHILNETLCYQVDQITETEPDNTSALSVEEKKDLATLLTCTPYGVNSHRLLVRGHRTEYVKSAMEETPKSLFGISPHTNYLLWVIVGLAVTGAVIGVLYARERKQKKKAAAAQTKERMDADNGSSADHKEYEDNGSSADCREHENNGGSADCRAYENNEGSADCGEYEDNGGSAGYREYEDNADYTGYREYEDNDAYTGYRDYTENDVEK